MKWQGRRGSGNVDDRRGSGMGVGLPVGGGIGGIVLLLLISAITGTNPLDIINSTGAPASESSGVSGVRDDDPRAQFIAVVLADTEDTWGEVFRQGGRSYEPPVLVLFDGATQSACGVGRAEVGPFYCPSDQRVYLDLSFFRELDQRFDAPGDFAQAYVVAHEVGHHVQHLLGVDRQAQQAGNAGSVRLELQADCYAGVVWGHPEARAKRLEQGDIDEGLAAAAAIGDDRLTKGRVSPDSFTHGTSQQRAQWLSRGLSSGNPASCDTFGSTTY